MTRLRVVVVDDELSMREYLELLLRRAGYEVETAASVREFLRLAEAGPLDLVVSDMKLGAESGLEVLRQAKGLPSQPEVLLITAFGTPATAVEAMRRGAYDYIAKPFDNDELLLLLQKAAEKRALQHENRQLRATLVPRESTFLMGDSAAMKTVWAMVDKVATAARSTVLISGESGTGKEVIARAIHLRSSRAGRPFVAVNCGALAEGVLESELFGHVRGSFTGAVADRVGLLVSAGEGTVLLDEVGELPPATQVKLLRVLQERRVRPVGSSGEVPFDARILAATNRRLEEEVKQGRFREDLLYRLNVITIEVPPLRERRDDIPLLADYFLGRVAKDLGRPGLHFQPGAIECLCRFGWSGNVRQLQNIVERAATLADGEALGIESLPPSLRGVEEVSTTSVDAPLVPGFSLERHLDALERRYLQEALRRSNGVKTHAADLLGLSFRSFRYRLAKQGIGDSDPP